MAFLDRFAVLLLDMNGTFMFGHDRFGSDQDYFATYNALGGSRLHRAQLLPVFSKSLAALTDIYNDPARFDDFPTLAEVFSQNGAPEDDLPILERVFAAHEIGDVPQLHADFIRRVASTHALGVVSNICSHPSLWLARHPSAAVFAAFRTLVFSSEGRSVKPSSVLLDRALAQFPSEGPILFIGDDLERDILPAKARGLSTAWIAPPGSIHPAADRIVELLPELASAT